MNSLQAILTEYLQSFIMLIYLIIFLVDMQHTARQRDRVQKVFCKHFKQIQSYQHCVDKLSTSVFSIFLRISTVF